MPDADTRHSLIIRLKGRQNEVAWEEFVLQYESFLRRLAVRLGTPEQDVADVVQHILLTIAHSIDSWSDDGSPASFRRWLKTVSRNVVIRFIGRQRRQPAGEGGSDIVELLNEVPATPDESQLHTYEYELIIWAAEQVRDEYVASSWHAFWATVIEQRPVGEVATELNLTPGSIYMSRSRIMAGIRRKVEFLMKET